MLFSRCRPLSFHSLQPSGHLHKPVPSQLSQRSGSPSPVCGRGGWGVRVSDPSSPVCGRGGWGVRVSGPLSIAALLILLIGISAPLSAEETSSLDQLAEAWFRVERLRDEDRKSEVTSGSEATAAAFEKRYGREVFKRRAEQHLQKTALLDQRWGIVISDTELQRELDRIARQTRRPERLRELFATLGNDSVLIVEVLVRPHLVDKRLRSIYQSIHSGEKSADSFESWVERQSELLYQQAPAKAAEVHLPKILGSGSDQPDSWTRELPEGPQAKTGQSAIWTGSELIVWGGAVPGRQSNGLWTNAGFSYNPITDIWTQIRLDESTPAPRAFHTAVWTGAKMIVWGGEAWDEETTPPYFVSLNTGGVYDPVEDRWVATPVSGAPSARSDHSAVWTGTEMIIWGGMLASTGGEDPPPNIPHYTPLNDGSRFDPSFSGWTAMGGTPPTARGRAAVVWTGDEMLIVGGFDGSSWVDPDDDSTAFSSYDPVTDLWDTSLPQPSGGGAMSPPFEAPRALWTGESLWVAQPATGRLVTRYSAGVWTEPMAPPITGDRRYTSLAWTGRRLILWGGVTGTPGSLNARRNGLIYDTLDASWSTIPADPSAPTARFGHFGVWTGSEMIIWGGAREVPASGSPSRPRDVASNGKRLQPDWDTPASSVWVDMPEPPFVAGRGHTAVWTGSELVVWGGESYSVEDRGAVYDPMLDRWSTTRVANPPDPRSDHTAVWTGSQMIVWGGVDDDGLALSTGGLYNPVLDSWSDTGGTPPAARTDHTAVWTGSEMIVWGGFSDSDTLSSGASYDPALDQWTATGGTPPEARGMHTAVWTGSEMVVFGGLTNCPGSCAATNDAAIYDPTLDSWSASFEPAGNAGARWGHRAVWTGDRMINWGGTDTYLDSNPCLADGVEIDPTVPSATLMTANGDPRCHHSAVWNGVEMIVWGGVDRTNVSTELGVEPELANSSGARLEVASGTWAPTLDDDSTPPGTQRHTAVWTGEEMLVWGGRPEISSSLRVYYTDTRPTADPELQVDGQAENEVLLGGPDESIELGHTLPVAFFDDVEGTEQWSAGARAQVGGSQPWNVSVAGACSDGGDYSSPFSAWRFGEPGTCHYQGDDGTFTLTSDQSFTFNAQTYLQLRYLLGTDQVSNPAELDSARIEVSDDDGASWVTVAIDLQTQETGSEPNAMPMDDTGTVWRGLVVPLAEYVAATSQGRVRFVFERQGSLDNGVGWLLDDISIGEPAGDGRLPAGTLAASDGSVAQHLVAAHDRWDQPSFAWDLDGDGSADNLDPTTPVFQISESDLADYGLDVPGSYPLELTVTDLNGQQESASVTLEVVDGDPPVVEVLAPNGGEAWPSGSTQVITWSASDNIGLAGFDVAYYNDETGDGPVAITCAEALDGDSRACTWTLPDLTSTAFRVEVTARDQRPAPDGPNTAVDASDRPFYVIQAGSDEIRTLIVWHRDRLEARFGAPDADAVAAGLVSLASHVKIDGQVLDLANVPALDPLYAAWDGTVWSPAGTDDADDNIQQAIALAGGIQTYLFEQISQSFTRLEYLVLVGGDSLIPFWRMDEDLPRYPESNYIEELQTFGLLDDASSPEAFCAETENPMMAAVCRDHYLADTPYGASQTANVPGSSFTWWIPDLAVGRMVETPEQILGLIDVFVAQDGVTVVDRALTTGYDFLTDGGDAVHSLLQSELDLGATQIDRLSQSVAPWSDVDLLDRLFGVPPTEPADLSFVSGHADHRAEGAAQTGDAGVLTTQEMDAALVENRGGILVGVGCHSGFSVEADGGASDEFDPAFLLDLPELLAEKSFPAMVGHGGYGWGFSEGVGLGEQLVLMVAEEMTRAGQISVGEALRLAKQEYFLRQSRLDSFDHKVLHEAMVFGIPNYEVRLITSTDEPEPRRPRLGDTGWTEHHIAPNRHVRQSPVVEVVKPSAPRHGINSEATFAWSPAGTAQKQMQGSVSPWRRSSEQTPSKGISTLRILDFVFQAYEEGQDTDGDPGTEDWQEAYVQFDWCTDVEGESVLCTGAMGEEAVGTYFTLDRLASVEAGQPIQPMISFDSQLFGTELHGVLIRGGELIQPDAINPVDPARCTDEQGTVHPCFNPVIGNPETEVDEEEGPAPTPFINIDTPTPFINIDTPTSVGFLAAGSGGGRFDTMNAPMGVAVRRGVREPMPGEREEIFSQWLYRTREFTNFYSNSSDWQPPVLGAFTADCEVELKGDDCFHQLNGQTATFDVPVTDSGDGIYRVYLTFAQDVDEQGRGAWQSVEMMPTGPGRFGADLQVERTTYYFVQAVDWAGNIGVVSVSGDDVDSEGEPIGSSFDAARLFTISTGEDVLFGDGFEGGDTVAWSSTSP